MNIAQPDSLTGNLHFKPISARLARGVAWTSTSLQKNASITEWHGHVVVFLSKASIIAGSIVCIPLALIEALAGFAIGGIGIAINRFLLDGSSEFFQKHSLKAISYATNSAGIIVALFILSLKIPDLRHHTANAVVDHALHIGSAGFIQCTLGAVLDKSAGRSPQLAITRTINLFTDSQPDLVDDLAGHIQGDFDINIRERIAQLPQLQTYLNNHPEDRDFITNFNLQRLLQDRAYRGRAGEMVRRFLTDMRLAGPAVNQNDALRIELNQNNAEESAYQENLARLLKNAFLEIYRTPALFHCLDKDGTPGNDLLQMMDAATYVPLTTYTQYQELLQPIQCPGRFTGNLTRYNERRTQVIAAQAQVQALTEEQKAELVQKILRGSDIDAHGPVQQAYISISQLAPALYQGPLMMKAAIDLAGIDQGNVIQVRNLFQRACQEAIAEIG